MLRAQYLKNSWRYNLAEIANYYISYEAVRSAILATAWLLVTIDRAAYATVWCPSVVCNVCIVAKRCVLPKICLKKQIENGLLWESNGHVTDDVTRLTTIRLGPSILKTAAGDGMLFINNRS